MQILKRLGAELYFYGPEQWYSSEFDSYGKYMAIDHIIDQLDVLMLLRVQHERHDGSQSFSKEDYHRQFGLTEERYRQLKEDRKSTRLNSSHANISYAVFCLK